MDKSGKRAKNDEREADLAAQHQDQWWTARDGDRNLVDLVAYAIADSGRMQRLTAIGGAVTIATCTVTATAGLVLHQLGLRIQLVNGSLQLAGGGVAIGVITLLSGLAIRWGKNRAAKRRRLTPRQRSIGN